MLNKDVAVGTEVVLRWNLSGTYIGTDWQADHNEGSLFGTPLGDGHIWRPRGRFEHYLEGPLSMRGVRLSRSGANLWWSEEQFLEKWEVATPELLAELDEVRGEP